MSENHTMTGDVACQEKTPWTEKFPVNVGTIVLLEKPESEKLRREVSANLGRKKSVKTVTLKELLDYIRKGYAFCDGHIKGWRIAKNFAGQYLLWVDVDNKFDDIPFMTNEGFKYACEAAGLSCAAIYYSFSHTNGRPKFRACFVLDVPITDPELAKRVKEHLIYFFAQADVKTVNLAGFFYPCLQTTKTSEVILTNKNATFVTADQILALPDNRHKGTASKTSKDTATKTPIIEDYDDDFVKSEGEELCGKFPLQAFIQWLANYRDWKITSHGEYMRVDPCPFCGHRDCGTIYAHTYCCYGASRPDDIPEAGNIYTFLRHVEGYSMRVAWAYIRKAIVQHEEKGTFPKLPKRKDTAESTKKKTKRTLGESAEALALLFLKEFGRENIMYTKSFFWIFQDGLWTRSEDLAVLQRLKNLSDEAHFGATIQVLNNALKFLEIKRYENDVTFNSATPRSVPCPNGLVTIDTDGQIACKPHAREDYTTSSIPVPYNQNASNPVPFIKFLREVFENDEDLMRLSFEILGYCLLADSSLERFFILTGSGANGKSVFLKVLQALLGAINCAAVPLSKLGDDFCKAHLHGKRANILTELPYGQRIPEDVVKATVSGETCTGAPKGKPHFEYSPFHTLVIATNHLPRTSDFSDGLFRRIVILPFNRTFSEAEQDPLLAQTLCTPESLEGILNFALRAVAKVYQRGAFTMPKTVRVAREKWRFQNDQIRQFLDSDLVVIDGDATVLFDVLYKTYKEWAIDSGIPFNRLYQKNGFGERLTQLGFSKKRGAQGKAYRCGLKLQDFTEDNENSYLGGV